MFMKLHAALTLSCFGAIVRGLLLYWSTETCKHRNLFEMNIWLNLTQTELFDVDQQYIMVSIFVVHFRFAIVCNYKMNECYLLTYTLLIGHQPAINVMFYVMFSVRPSSSSSLILRKESCMCLMSVCRMCSLFHLVVNE